MYIVIVGGFLFLTVKNSIGIIPPNPHDSTAQLSEKAGNKKPIDIEPQKPLPNPRP